MGLLCCCSNKKKQIKIVMTGLNSAGKTTILYKNKIIDSYTTIPTIVRQLLRSNDDCVKLKKSINHVTGFNVETFEYKKFLLQIWDCSGCNQAIPWFRFYFTNARALIFVIDSNNRDRFKEAKDALKTCLTDTEFTAKNVLIFANKQDLPNSASGEEIKQELALDNFNDIRFHIQPSCALTGSGINDGFDWLCRHVL